MAVNMIERSAAAMFVDFPDGHDSFETVMNTYTRGDQDIKFEIAIIAFGEHTMNFSRSPTAVDVKEQLMIHAYRDLVDFVLDFQKNGTGKPTKRMLRELNNWDPSLDLQQTSESERLRWRRCYTINWLYDLVNVFSSLVLQRKAMRGKEHESVDWSTAAKILPHHVFQLQCIVDSFTVSPGWIVNALKGHVLGEPAHSFRSRRDVDMFLDPGAKRPFAGILQGIDVFELYLKKDRILHDDPSRNKGAEGILNPLKFDFLHCLGESKDMHGSTIPPSRFSSTNPNGLWE